jgi:hypothetical protein
MNNYKDKHQQQLNFKLDATMIDHFLLRKIIMLIYVGLLHIIRIKLLTTENPEKKPMMKQSSGFKPAMGT